MLRRSGLGRVRRASHRPDLNGVEVGNPPTRIEPNLETQSPRSMKPLPPRATEPDARGREPSTANGTTTTPGPGTRTTAADGNGETSSQRNPAALEDPESHGRSEMSNRRRRQPPPGNRSWWWSEVDEPADPMCVHWGWRGVAAHPLRTPGIPRRCPARGRAAGLAAAPSRRCADA